MSNFSHREHRRADLRRRAEALERAGRADFAAQEAQARAAEERARLESAHPEFAEASLRRATAAQMTKVAVPCIWALDVFLLGASTHYLAYSLDLRGAWLSFAKYGMPGLFIALDLWIASLRASARDAHHIRENRSTRTALLGWNAIVAVLLAGYATLAYRTQSLAFEGGAAGTGIAFGVAALVLVIHSVLLLGGGDLKPFVLYGWRHGRAARREQRAAASSRAAGAAAVAAFNRLSLDLESYRAQYPQLPFQMAYSLPVRGLLRRELGYEVIQAAPGATSPAPPQVPLGATGVIAPAPSDHEVQV